MVVVAKELAKRSLDKTSGGDIGCGMGNANQLCKTEKRTKKQSTTTFPRIDSYP